ncbi:MAG: hypothetical protein LKF48_04195 [Prevotella sp.]|jgi:ATP-binding cassette subfamily B protein|nr:hypothetical protein [Prevotella sp.]MCH4182354.1 hypothetical protein [Prevotella sp.]MCH4212487.1 hypothetical protein [Prevotella sp.]MCH4240718.1 hypothetical protein [Prevotella sp.]
MRFPFYLQTSPKFYRLKEDPQKKIHSFCFLSGYARPYRRYFAQIVLGLVAGSLLQLVLPFLTQSIVDVGIAGRNNSVNY